MGILFAIMSSIAYGVSDLLIQVGIGTGRANSSQALLMASIWSSAILTGVFIVSCLFSVPALNWHSVAYFVTAGLLGPLGGLCTSVLAIRIMGATRTASIRATECMFAIPISYILLHQYISPTNTFGIIVIAVGISLFVAEAFNTLQGGTADMNESQPAPRNTSPKQRESYLKLANSEALQHIIGIMLALLSGFLFAVGGALRQLGISITPSALLGSAIGSITALLFTTAYLAVTHQLRNAYMPVSRQALPLILSGILQGIGRFTFFLALAFNATVAVSTALKNIAPVFTFLFAYILLPKQGKPNLQQGILVACVVLGAILASLRT